MPVPTMAFTALMSIEGARVDPLPWISEGGVVVMMCGGLRRSSKKSYGPCEGGGMLSRAGWMDGWMDGWRDGGMEERPERQ